MLRYMKYNEWWSIVKYKKLLVMFERYVIKDACGLTGTLTSSHILKGFPDDPVTH